MLGSPGCGVLQMNGQPTAQNTRECGADGDLPGFRNWANDDHVADLARIWNVEPERIPHHAPPTHAMQIFRFAEQGSVRLLWISGTNPAVSMPDLARIRSVLAQERLFLVVQDIFPTETTELADVVLPAAAWGEKTGTFTNTDRTVHLSEKAVEPPGEARPDLEIFLDYAGRMGFTGRDGTPLVGWTGPESAFRAWQECSRGRPCDYTGLSYERLRAAGGVQWPCDRDHPDGTERLYSGGRFWAAPEYCESFGRDLVTGAPVEEVEYRSLNPSGKAVIRSAGYLPPHEAPDELRPFHLITGRTVHHFHTRTKTARAPQLRDAAPEVWVEMSAADAEAHDMREGDLAEVSSPRGVVHATVRVTGIRSGVLFLPFHYGYWDLPEGAARTRAANELTITDWDPASKQPLFKTGVATLRLLERGGGPSSADRAAKPDRLGAERRWPMRSRDERNRPRPAGAAPRRTRSRPGSAARLRTPHRRPRDPPRGPGPVRLVPAACARARRDRRPVRCPPGHRAPLETGLGAKLRGKGGELVGHRGPPGMPLLHDLRHVHVQAAGVSLDWEMIAQAARGNRDTALLRLVERCHPDTLRQMRWANAHLKQLSAQVLHG
ncbi:molybdopterin oxidoreductase family protein [Actinomadura luteofluorescens]|uniref:molybdopterin oxidoreductase family protein n=1 Tax=Actinomadura luteofluorescens TaxID=46163 RepID=UPI00364472C8